MAVIGFHEHKMIVHCYRLRLRSSPVGAAIRTGSLLLVRIRSLWRRWTPHSSLSGSTSITSSSLERAAVGLWNPSQSKALSMSAPSGFSWKARFQGAFRACKATSSAQPTDIPNYIDFCHGFHHCFNGFHLILHGFHKL